MDLNRLIAHPELLNRETLYALRNYVALYPYHQAARLLMLHNLYILHDLTFDEELHTAAFYITNRTTLFNMVEAQYYHLAPAVKSTAATGPAASADTLIDTFLDAVPAEETTDHKPTIIDATVDYMAYKISNSASATTDDSAPTAATEESLIDNFLQKDGGKITIPEGTPTKGDGPHTNVALENDRDELQEGFYTESLAKVYMKQGNYSKAYEIIKQINLNSSEKSCYFADQMRFLEKVIAAKKK